MRWLEPFLSNPALIGLAAVFIALIAALCLLVAVLRRNNRISARLTDVEKALDSRMDMAFSESGAQAQRSREELTSNLRGMGDSVTRVMSDMARTQQIQLDAFAAQLRDMSGAEERRLADMRQSFEGRLASYEGRMDRIGTVLDDKLTQNEQRMDRIRETLETQMSAMQSENGRRIEEMRAAVDQKLTSTLDRRLGESFQAVSERLDQVYRGLGEMQSLSSGVGDLKRVLTNVRTRGLLGEIQLGTLLEQVLSDGQYQQNARLGAQAAACDYAVKLPAHDGEQVTLLPIDAHFPLETYHQLLDALDTGSQQAADQARAGLRDALAERAAYIHDHFIAPPETTPFAVMFLPVEGLYAEALHFTGLTERLQREHGVTLAGPTTLTALLNSLQMGFKTLAIERRTNEVWELLGAVRGDFRQFADALSATQEQMQKAVQSIDSVASRSRGIENRLKSVKRLVTAPGGQLEEKEVE